MTHHPAKSRADDPQAIEMRADLARAIMRHLPSDGKVTTAVAGLGLYRRSMPTDCMCVNYEPELIIFVQGEKRINMGDRTLVCDGSSFLLTSVDMPVVSQVTQASPEKPILGMTLKLEMPIIREILAQQEFHLREEATAAHGMAAGITTADLLRPCLRLVELLDAPEDIPFLGVLVQREILYRLLRGPLGRNLRAIATLGEQSHRTAKAVAWLRANYTKPLRVEELASLAQMGVSTLHHQFRTLTSMSPLQYQKQLRLQAARERMLNNGMDAASAAFDVGYESASQFNREYRRLFGVPPMRDVKSRLMVGAVATSD